MGVICAIRIRMSNSIVEKLEKELLDAMSNQAEDEKSIRDLAHRYRKAKFGPDYENPKSVGNTCSFCGKPETKIKQLVAGASSFICNECIELCYEIIHESKDCLLYTSPSPRDS